MISSSQAKNISGAVMVIGGGIAGIQAALDLADSGFKVYLVESTAAIGGNMARLDKTFPTNDCSLCILSPKLVEAARHRNIELLTLAAVQSVDGAAGRFQVEIRQQARYVDNTKCTGCGLCLTHCPTRYQPRFQHIEDPIIISLEHQQLADEMLSIYGASPSAVIRILQEINERLRYLPQALIRYLAQRLAIPVSRLHQLGTFYKAFSLVPRGQHSISICGGTACHIRGAARLIDEFQHELKIAVGQSTPDLRFSLEVVRCLGCCSLAPVVKIDDQVYGHVKPAQITKLLQDYSR